MHPVLFFPPQIADHVDAAAAAMLNRDLGTAKDILHNSIGASAGREVVQQHDRDGTLQVVIGRVKRMLDRLQESEAADVRREIKKVRGGAGLGTICTARARVVMVGSTTRIAIFLSEIQQLRGIIQFRAAIYHHNSTRAQCNPTTTATVAIAVRALSPVRTCQHIKLDAC